MIVVRLYWNVKGERVRVGKLELFGLPVGKTDGTSLVEVETASQIKAQIRLTPAGIASKTELRSIVESVCEHEIEGRAGRYDWEIDEVQLCAATRGHLDLL